MQVSALTTGVRQLEDTFRIVIRFWRLAQYFGSGRRRCKCGTTYHATAIMTDICGQRYRLPNRVRKYGLIFGVQIAVTNSTHGLSVCWYLLYKPKQQSKLSTNVDSFNIMSVDGTTMVCACVLACPMWLESDPKYHPFKEYKKTVFCNLHEDLTDLRDTNCRI